MVGRWGSSFNRRMIYRVLNGRATELTLGTHERLSLFLCAPPPSPLLLACPPLLLRALRLLSRLPLRLLARQILLQLLPPRTLCCLCPLRFRQILLQLRPPRTLCRLRLRQIPLQLRPPPTLCRLCLLRFCQELRVDPRLLLSPPPSLSLALL